MFWYFPQDLTRDEATLLCVEHGGKLPESITCARTLMAKIHGSNSPFAAWTSYDNNGEYLDTNIVYTAKTISPQLKRKVICDLPDPVTVKTGRLAFSLKCVR